MKSRLHAMGTTLEGELDEVLAVVRRCFEALQADCDRISCSIKIDYRKGPGGRLQSKVQKVQALVVRPLKTGGLLRIWLATERVVIGNGTVSLTSGLFRVKQTMPLDQVKAIHVDAPLVPVRGRVRSIFHATPDRVYFSTKRDGRRDARGVPASATAWHPQYQLASSSRRFSWAAEGRPHRAPFQPHPGEDLPP